MAKKKAVAVPEVLGLENVSLTVDNIDPNKIITGANVRLVFDDAKQEALVSSVRGSGIIEPLIVNLSADGIYILIAGERRLRAAITCQLLTVPCVIYSQLTEKQIKILMMSENLLRSDLSAIELAHGFKQLNDEGMTQSEIGALFGVTQGYISQYLKILELEPYFQNEFITGVISLKQALAILKYRNADWFEDFVSFIKEAATKKGFAEADSLETSYDSGLYGFLVRDHSGFFNCYSRPCCVNCSNSCCAHINQYGSTYCTYKDCPVLADYDKAAFEEKAAKDAEKAAKKKAESVKKFTYSDGCDIRNVAEHCVHSAIHKVLVSVPNLENLIVDVVNDRFSWRDDVDSESFDLMTSYDQLLLSFIVCFAPNIYVLGDFKKVFDKFHIKKGDGISTDPKDYYLKAFHVLQKQGKFEDLTDEDLLSEFFPTHDGDSPSVDSNLPNGEGSA